MQIQTAPNFASSATFFGDGGHAGKPRVDDRRVISGIVHVFKSDGRSIDAPDVLWPRKTLYNRFVRRSAKGGGATSSHALASAGGTFHANDSSAVKAHRCASGAKGGNTIRRLVARALRTFRQRPTNVGKIASRRFRPAALRRRDGGRRRRSSSSMRVDANRSRSDLRSD